MRLFFSCLCLLAVCLPAPAQDQDGPIRITISPAPAPDPALRYRLFPSQMDRSLGNAALTYYRCLSPEWFTWRGRDRLSNAIHEALKAPLSSIPKEADWVLQANQLKELDRAARQESCNWEFLARMRQDGMGLLLPEIQACRLLGSSIAVRARLQLAKGQFDQSIYSLQTGFGLGYDLGSAPIAINALVGIAVAQMALDQVQDFVQQPAAPNLYWALATLPHPFVDWPKIIEGEQVSLFVGVPLLREIDKRRLSPEENVEFQQEMARLVDIANLAGRFGNEGKLGLTYLVLKQYPEARRALISQGRKAEDVDAMSALQVCAIYALQQYHRLEDEQMKWFYVPPDSAGVGPSMAEEQVRKAHAKLEGEPFGSLLSAYRRAQETSLRLERRIALLQTIEAVRLHAAAHGGLPTSLAAITAVPVPRDPANGKSFDYKIDGNEAVLSIPAYQYGRPRTYELTLRK